jgi:hypothetical protein
MNLKNDSKITSHWKVRIEYFQMKKDMQRLFLGKGINGALRYLPFFILEWQFVVS